VSSITQPEVGPTSVVYTIWNGNRLWAVNPNGTERWLNIWPELLQTVSLSPLDDLLLAGAQVTYGQPGYVQAFSTAGQPLWKVDLPFENGNWITTTAGARFTADGKSAYVGTVINDYAADPYSYLYALDTSSSAPVGPSLTGLTLSASAVTGGASAAGTVTLSAAAPAGGVVVSLSSSATAAVVPSGVTVPAGASTASFTVTTIPVSAAVTAVITAAYGGVSKTASLTVNPPSASDVVAIQRADYFVRKTLLRINSTSTGAPSAVLRAYVTFTNELIGTLIYTGGGKYQGQFIWPTNPQNITVRSSRGGSASRNVTVK
jgi:hypothetical protein